MRRFSSGLILFAAMLLDAPAAVACINDRSTVRTEQEFKTNYQFKSGYQEQQPVFESPPAPKTNWVPIAATGSGGILFLAAGFIAIKLRSTVES